MRLLCPVLLVLLVLAMPATIATAQTTNKRGIAAYDDFVEPVRTACIREWEREVAAVRKAIEDDKERLTRAQTAADRKKYSDYIKRYTERLAALEKNDPPYLNPDVLKNAVLKTAARTEPQPAPETGAKPPTKTEPAQPVNAPSAKEPPAPKPVSDDKPLDLATLLKQESARRKALQEARATYGKAGNLLAVRDLEKVQSAERHAVRGKVVEGVAQVWWISEVGLVSEVMLKMDVNDNKDPTMIEAFGGVAVNPVLAKLTRGQKVSVRGILRERDRGARWQLQDCTFTAVGD